MPNRYREGPDSTFTHMSNTYRVDDLIDAVEHHVEFSIECCELEWIFSTPENRPDPRRVAAADTTVPIIITQMVGGYFVVLDGLHRLAKSVVMGSPRIRVKFVPEHIVRRLKSVE